MPDRITAGEVARILGLGRDRTLKLLARLPGFEPDAHGRYDPRALDLLRAMRGLPHRALEPVHKDWLARYMKENT